MVDVLKKWCEKDPRDSYSDELHAALETLEKE